MKGLTEEETTLVVSTARAVLQATEAQALACDDEKERINLIREAQGAKKFLAAWLNAIK